MTSHNSHYALEFSHSNYSLDFFAEEMQTKAPEISSVDWFRNHMYDSTGRFKIDLYYHMSDEYLEDLTDACMFVMYHYQEGKSRLEVLNELHSQYWPQGNPVNTPESIDQFFSLNHLLEHPHREIIMDFVEAIFDSLEEMRQTGTIEY